MGPSISLGEKKYHAHCFSCEECGVNLKGSPFVKVNDVPICKKCHELKVLRERIPPKVECAKCNLCITQGEDFVEINGEKYHATHFQCSICKLQLGANLKEFEGKVYCPKHFELAISPTCGECNEKIEGLSVFALEKYYHPHHLKCFQCNIVIGNSAFRVHNDHPYCQRHYYELMEETCGRCYEPILEPGINALGKKWHKGHCVCVGCDKDFTHEKEAFVDWDGKAICNSCYGNVPIQTRKRLAKYTKNELSAKNAMEKRAQKQARG